MSLENLSISNNEELEQDARTIESAVALKSESLSAEVGSLSQEILSMEHDLFSKNPELGESVDAVSLQVINQDIESLRAQTDNCIKWIKERFNLSKMEQEQFLDINIQGCPEFREVIKGSLKFLNLAPEKLNFVQKNVKRIQEWEHSGMNMFKNVPTFEIGDIWKDENVELYLASGIAHDAYHSFLCQQNQDEQGNIYLDSFVGKEAEKKCLNYQIDTLRDISKSEYFKDHQDVIDGMINHLNELVKDPTYQEIPYEDRNW